MGNYITVIINAEITKLVFLEYNTSYCKIVNLNILIISQLTPCPETL